MPSVLSRRVLRPRVAVALASLVLPLLAVGRASADPLPWGSVLVTGSGWAGRYASLGDLNVYSNGNGNQDQISAYGDSYECVELAQRWAAIRYGEQPMWPVAYAYQMWDVAPTLRIPFRQLPNGGPNPPQSGDLIV